MSVSSTTTKNSYSANGTAHSFAYGFKIFADADLSVVVRSSTGTETTKTLNTHYIITNAGNDSGGNVLFKFNTGDASDAHYSGTDQRPANGETVVITRSLTLTQGTDYVANDAFPAESHEDALDRLTMITQQIQEEVDRSVKASVTNTFSSSEFTVSATDRANKIFAFDGSGDLSVTQELGTFVGNWAASTAYNARDLVKDTSTNNIFIAITAHTSSGSQPLTTNTDSAKWSLIVDAASATTSQNAAAASASTASTQATNSANSATASANSATSAANTLTTFQGQYHGAASSDPTSNLDAGDLYFNTSTGVKVYTGSAWVDVKPSSSEQTNINTVAGANSNISALAASAVIDDMALLANSDVIADMALLATTDVISDMNTLATSDIISDINTLATADIVSDLNQLATSDFVSDLNTMATTTNVNNLGTVAGAVSNVNTVAGIASDVSAVSAISSDVAAVENIASNVTSVAGNASNINSAVSNASNINAAVSNASNINSVAGIAANVTTVAGIASNVTTVAGASSNVSTVAGAITNVNNVGGSIANVNTVATNISGVNSFAERYRVGSNDPSSSLDAGDLAYNTSDNALKYYTGSAWASITAGIGNIVEDTSPQLGGALDVNGNSITSASNGDITIDPNGTGDIVLDANVGIGTATPAVASGTGLQIHNATSGAQTRLSLTNNSTGSASSDGMQLVIENGGGALIEQREAQHLGFATSATERMRLTSAGSLGLGTSSPDALLQIEKSDSGTTINKEPSSQSGPNIAIHNSNQTANNLSSIQFTNRGTNGVAETATAGIHVKHEAQGGTYSYGSINFNTTNSAGSYATRMHIAPSGNVGIGTASVDNKLHLENAGSLYLQIENTSAANKFYVGNSSGSAILESTGSYSMNFKTNSTERMRLDSSGNLLHGKTASGIANNGIELRANNDVLITKDGATALYLNRKSSDGEIIEFRKDGTGVGVIGTQNWGIGTSSPSFGTTSSAGLEIAHATRGILRLEGNSAAQALELYGDSAGGTIDARGSGAVLAFDIGGSEKARFISNSTPHFLVGCTSEPSSSVAGTAISTTDAGSFQSFAGTTNTSTHAAFGNTNGVLGTIRTTASATQYNTSSDRRLKSNIQDAASASDKIDAIQVRQFDWNADDIHQDYGLIAQELQPIEPLAVTGDADSDEMMAVDYSKLVPMLIKEIQELRSRVAALEAS